MSVRDSTSWANPTLFGREEFRNDPDWTGHSIPSNNLRTLAAVPVQFHGRLMRHLRRQRVPQMRAGIQNSSSDDAIRHVACSLQSAARFTRKSEASLYRWSVGKRPLDWLHLSCVIIVHLSRQLWMDPSCLLSSVFDRISKQRNSEIISSLWPMKNEQPSLNCLLLLFSCLTCIIDMKFS